MRQGIEKTFFDWSRDKSPRIQSRGIAAIVQNPVKFSAGSRPVGTTRCVWPTSLAKGDTRYLSRRIWMS